MRNTIAVLVALFVSGIAAGQTNVLVNGDFETNSAQNFGNNTPISIPPWTLGPGDDANIVKVDGPGGYNYGTDGPESDASAPGAGVDQYYLDIVGENQFYQAFTPQCSGSIEFGGAFSTRALDAGTGSITIRQGAGFTGAIVGQTNTVNLPAGDSQTWTSVMFTVPVVAGQTYSFVVDMDNQVNFDNAFVYYLTACEAVDPCCPPWTTSMLTQVMYYQGTGSISAPYTLKYQPNATFSAQLQAYINYLHSVNPAITQITINFRLHDGGGNGTTPVMGTQLGSQFWVT
ncbi:MAG TPA: hypothetical protein VGD79_12575, partial [Thermoanaerobaculia bacterium]